MRFSVTVGLVLLLGALSGCACAKVALHTPADTVSTVSGVACSLASADPSGVATGICVGSMVYDVITIQRACSEENDTPLLFSEEYKVANAR